MKPTNKQSVDQMHLIDSKSSVFLHAACVPVSDPSSSTVLYNFCVILFEHKKLKQRRAKAQTARHLCFHLRQDSRMYLEF